MAKYISEQSLKDAYINLTLNKYSNPNEMFYLLICKFAGISTTRYIDLNDELIKNRLLDAVKTLGYLYIDDSFQNEQYNFINPLAMTSWVSNSKDNIKLWSRNRFKNNIVAGSAVWREILFDNIPSNTAQIKLKHNYLDNINTDVKVPIDALAIWVNRFNQFDKDVNIYKLIESFKVKFCITEEELRLFSRAKLNLTYSDNRISPHVIRSWIGNPNIDPGWLERTKKTEESRSHMIEVFNENFHEESLDTGHIEKSDLIRILDNTHQIILVGPPGTSKSYIAKQIAESGRFYDFKRIQFHPQYTYQDFIGGKVFQNNTIIDKKGILIKLIEEAIQYRDNEYLLIIEEINRANVSQVFGELIQLLDRDEKLYLTFNDISNEYYIPTNLKIIGTMNSTDRTLGRIDFAIKRRFYEIYCGVNYDLLSKTVMIKDNLFPIELFLAKLNNSLTLYLNNVEMVIGHAIFMKNFVFNHEQNKFVWPISDFIELFYYSILPLITAYCGNNQDIIRLVLGNELSQLQEEDVFIELIGEYIY